MDSKFLEAQTFTVPWTLVFEFAFIRVNPRLNLRTLI